jgi:hypothetical protein
MPSDERGIFVYESATVPDELRVVDSVVEALKRSLPGSLIQSAHHIEDARMQNEAYRSRSGADYALAVISLNLLTEAEVDYLLRGEAFSVPRCIFLGSLRQMTAEAYVLARGKIHRESQDRTHSTSCLDCYGPANRKDVAPHVAELAAAYLREAAEWQRTDGAAADEGATRLLRSSPTTFYGSVMKSGSWQSAANHTPPPGAMTSGTAKSA